MGECFVQVSCAVSAQAATFVRRGLATAMLWVFVAAALEIAWAMELP
jgi:hypothetical protein